MDSMLVDFKLAGSSDAVAASLLRAQGNPSSTDVIASGQPWDPTTGLPIPGIAPVVPNRKSHARKRPEGHIKRPPNSWILFRSDFVYAQKVRVTDLRVGDAMLICKST
jgi:hypothetical protein